MPVLMSHPIPAGNTRPVPIPPGQRVVSVINNNGGNGDVSFNLNGVINHLPYLQGVPDPGTNFNFTALCRDYDFTNNPAAGPNPPDVIVKVEY